MKTLTLRIDPDGNIDVQGVQEGKAESVEKEFKWLLGELGEVEARGHKHTHLGEVGVNLQAGV